MKEKFLMLIFVDIIHVLHAQLQIRSGEYEGLEAKLKQPEWAPDFGTANFVPSWGGTVTGEHL